METRPLLSLCMIVKNEAHTMASTLLSIKPYIDQWFIIDTGSTDGTQEIIQKTMNGVYGVLYEEPFENFAVTRNKSLEFARCDYNPSHFTMYADADDILLNGSALREYLETQRNNTTSAYYLKIDTGIVFTSTRVFPTDACWRFVGAVHEVLIHPEYIPCGSIPDVKIMHYSPPISAEASCKRWERDLVLLKKDLDENPKNARAAFYYANTLTWLGRYDLAKVAHEYRISLGGWNEEQYDSSMSLARIAVALQYDFSNIINLYLNAYNISPHRAEPLFEIANYYHNNNNSALCFLFAYRAFQLSYPIQDKLFIDENVYKYKAAELVGIHAWYLGEFEIGEAAARKASLANPNDERLAKNLKFYLDRK